MSEYSTPSSSIGPPPNTQVVESRVHHSSGDVASNPGLVPKALDAEELEDYLSSLLLPQVFLTLRYFPHSLSASFCRNLLSFLTLCIGAKTNTPACKSLGLKLTARNSFTSSIAIYFILKFVLPFLRTNLLEANDEESNQNNNNDIRYNASNISSINNSEAVNSGLSIEQKARIRQEKMLKLFDSVLPLTRLLLLINCWGKPNKMPLVPSLEQFLAGLQYQHQEVSIPLQSSSSKIGPIHVLYAHRRWIHQNLSRCIPLLIMPLVQSARESRQLLFDWTNLLLLQPPRRLFSNRSLGATRTNRKCRSCPICQQNPMIIPVQTNCYHVYCYCCLYDYLVQKSRRHCQICHQQIVSCRPLQIDKNH